MPGGGSLLQLVAQGKQDVFLTGNPQITWFKMVYRRYTNFSIESQVMYFDGDPDFGRRLTCLVPRRGDLLGPIMLEVVLPQLTLIDGTPVPYTNAIGHALIDEITLEIGEQEIDKQTGEWFELWSSLAVPPGLQRTHIRPILSGHDTAHVKLRRRYNFSGAQTELQNPLGHTPSQGLPAFAAKAEMNARIHPRNRCLVGGGAEAVEGAWAPATVIVGVVGE